ncbi:hypothetical protein KC321_g57 [Hortaea werneckii]|nr:hypothetical protein KC321_g57 [Hortaea werneckii]
MQGVYKGSGSDVCALGFRYNLVTLFYRALALVHWRTPNLMLRASRARASFLHFTRKRLTISGPNSSIVYFKAARELYKFS